MTRPHLVAPEPAERVPLDLPPALQRIGQVVHHAGTPSFAAVSVLLDPEVDVMPGQLLAVWHGRRRRNLLTVVQVANCVEINPNEDPELATARDRLGLPQSYAEEGVSTRIFRMASSDTVEELTVELTEAGGIALVSSGAPEALARAGDLVAILPGHLAQAALGSKPDPAAGIHVGRTRGSQAVDVTLPPEILQMHVGVFGSPGKGKSYLSGVIMEEAHAWSVPMLALDLNGEFIEAAQALGGLVICLPDRERFGLALSLLSSRELVSIAPNVQLGTQYAELIEIAHDRLKGGGGDITFDALEEAMTDLAHSLKMANTSAAAARNRVNALRNDPLLVREGASFDFIAELAKHRLVVLDCRLLTLRQTQLIAAAAARRLQAHGRKMTTEANAGDADAAKWFSLLLIDEAHAVAPNSENVVSTQVLHELARMGRHVRTGLLLASQSPADLDRSVLKKLQTRFVFAIEKDQLASIGGIAADIGDDMLARLHKLPRGVCAVSGTSELIKHGFLLDVRPRVTPVGGGTPPVFDRREKKPVTGKR